MTLGDIAAAVVERHSQVGVEGSYWAEGHPFLPWTAICTDPSSGLVLAARDAMPMPSTVDTVVEGERRREQVSSPNAVVEDTGDEAGNREVDRGVSAAVGGEEASIRRPVAIGAVVGLHTPTPGVGHTQQEVAVRARPVEGGDA